MTAEPVSTQDNPPTVDVPKTSDPATELVQNYQEKIGAEPSGGEPVSTEPQPEPTPTGEPKTEDIKPDDTGKITRLEQQISKDRQLLTLLGIDPESDVADKLQAGLITKEDLLKQVGTQEVPGPAEVFSVDKLTQLEEKINKEGATQQDLLDTIKSIKAVANQTLQVQQVQQQSTLENRFIQCRNATQTVIDTDEMHQSLPDNIREIESQIHLSATDNLLATETGGGDKYLTPQAYGYYGTKNLERLNTYRNYLIELGKKMERENINPPPKPSVNPMSPTTGGAPASPPRKKVNMDRLADEMRSYVSRQATV